MFVADAVLAIFAALIHLPIREARLRPSREFLSQGYTDR